jgi:hypothetical protein
VSPLELYALGARNSLNLVGGVGVELTTRRFSILLNPQIFPFAELGSARKWLTAWMVSRVGIEPTTRRLRGFGKAYTSVDVAVQDFWFVDSDGLNCAL